jgi:hypothetical protein
LLAFGAVSEAQARGFEVGRDVSVTGEPVDKPQFILKPSLLKPSLLKPSLIIRLSSGIRP